MIQVSFYGPHDLPTLVASRDGQPGEGLEAMFGLDPSDEDLRSGSPAAQIHAGMPPYLLVHGTVRARHLWTSFRGGHKLSDCVLGTLDRRTSRCRTNSRLRCVRR